MAITLDGATGVTAAEFDGAVDASNLTGALPAIDGSALTGIDSGGVTLLGTLNTTSGSSVTLSGLSLTGYKFVYFIADRIKASNQYQSFWINSPVLNSPVISDTDETSNSSCAWLWLDLGTGILTSSVTTKITDSGSTVWASSDEYMRTFDTGFSTSTTSFTFTAANGAGAFGGGSIRIYGVA